MSKRGIVAIGAAIAGVIVVWLLGHQLWSVLVAMHHRPQ